MRVAHLAVQFGLRHQRRHRVHDEHVDGVRAHQGFDDFEGLLPIVRLADQQVIDVYSQFAGVGRIERVLGIDKRGKTSGLLGLGNNLQSNGRLTGGLGAEDLDDAAAGNSAHAQRCVERDGPGGDDRNRHNVL